jgi:hypothetical protein
MTSNRVTTRDAGITRPPSATSPIAGFPLSACRGGATFSDGRRGGGREGNDLVPSQCFQEGLEAAADNAAHPVAVHFHIADPRGPRDLPRRRGADEVDFDSLVRELLGHARQPEAAAGQPNRQD